MSESGAAAEIPPVEVSPQVGAAELSEGLQLDHNARRLDHGMRRLAGYGALFVAAVLYLAGLGAVCVFIRIAIQEPDASGKLWHIVFSTLVALFSVPTFLVFAVLRHAKPSASTADDEMLHTAVGERVLQLVAKFLKIG